jgi:hypothetical protein
MQHHPGLAAIAVHGDGTEPTNTLGWCLSNSAWAIWTDSFEIHAKFFPVYP